MKVHVKQRTGVRLMKAQALKEFEVSMWTAGDGDALFQVYAKDDPNGVAAKEAFHLAWLETFKGKNRIVLY